MEQARDILASKTSPPQVRVPLLARPRLTDLIREAETRKLLVLSADAGYGKTSLLLSALPNLTLPVAWLSLDADDTDVTLLCAGIVAAVRRVLPDFGEDVLPVLTTGPSPDILRVRVLRALEAAPPVLVVLDDFHVLDERVEAGQFIDRLLADLPASAHLIIATRTEPRLRLIPRLLVEGQALVVQREHLAFTGDETAALLRHSHGIDVAPDDARRLAARTEGWAAALQLVALAIKQRGPTALEGTPREVFDYLAATVVASLPDRIREFLVRTSILDELWPSLCRALMEEADSQIELADLERAHLFVSRLDEQGTRYRYHQLFAEFLRRQLERRGPEAVRALHRRAAAQLEAEGRPEQAVRHYMAAAVYEEAERVMKPIHGARLTAREAYVFRDLISTLPDEVVDQHPWMARSGASSCRYVGDYERALAFARRTLAAAEGRDVNLWAFSTHGIGVMHTHLDRFHDAVELITRALERIDASDLSNQIEPRMLAGLLTVLITARVQLGDLEAAEDVLHRLEGVPALGIQLGRGHADSYQAGVIAALKLEFNRALEYFAGALRAEESRNSLTFQTYVLTEIAAVEVARAAPTAHAALQRALDAHRRTGERATDLQLRYLQGDAHLLIGEMDAAAAAYQDTLARCRAGESAEPRIWALAGLARVARRRGRVAEAGSLLANAMALADQIHLGKARPALLLAQAALLAEGNRVAEAQAALKAAGEIFSRWGSAVGTTYCDLLDAAADGAGVALQPELAGTLREAAAVAADLAPLIRAEGSLLIPLLIRALQQGLAPEVATELLAAVGDAAVPGLLESLHAQPQLSTLSVLGRIGDPRARRPLQRLASTASPDVRDAARHALAQLRAPPIPALRVRLLGPFEVDRDGVRIDARTWRTRKAKMLLAYLLLYRGRPVHAEQVIDLLWPDSDPRSGATSLKTAVRHLRLALEPLLEGDRSHFVHRDGERLSFAPAEPCWIDLDEYDRLVAEGRRLAASDSGAAIAAYEQAARLYRGDLLEDARYEDWPTAERERRREQHLEMLESLAALHASRRDYRGAIEVLQRILALDRLREGVYQDLIRYSLLRGDRAAALRAYRICEQVLREELGVTPHPHTRALLEQVVGPA